MYAYITDTCGSIQRTRLDFFRGAVSADKRFSDRSDFRQRKSKAKRLCALLPPRSAARLRRLPCAAERVLQTRLKRCLCVFVCLGWYVMCD